MGLSKSDKILIAMVSYQEEHGVHTKMTVEDVAVEAWNLFDDEFALKGYPEYPNADIQKYITKLFDESLVKGGVQNYTVTEKGIRQANQFQDSEDQQSNSQNVPREVRQELSRIRNLKLLEAYEENPELDLRLADLLKFLGTTSQVLQAKDRNLFKTRFQLIDNDVISYVEQEQPGKADEIVSLWNRLKDEFKERYNDRI
jgi:hypothetical protein